ncbi:MAG: protein-L-isoaspartate(D-aspartate) O-methyltransferase [Planctomycetaceae bacterium]
MFRIPLHRPLLRPEAHPGTGVVRVLLLMVIAGAATTSTVIRADDRFEDQRNRMVDIAIEAEGISNPSVLKAMRTVPRHEFVLSAQKRQAYNDTALPIGHQQTISPPYVVAYMTETLDPQPNDRVLEIGTGSGYQAAVLAEIVKEVYSIEIVSPLAKSASRRLQDLGYENVHVLDGDGYKGWPEHAPFDRIIVTCSPEKVPQPLVEQLKEGGRMIIPVGERYQQAFYLLKKENGELQQERLISTLFVPMTGESESQRRVQPEPTRPEIINGTFEQDENDDGRVDGWHYQRHTEICMDEPMEGSRCLRFRNTEPGELAQALQGTAIDGRTIGSIQLQYWVRFEGLLNGAAPYERASINVHFYDHIRKEVGSATVGKWRGSLNWQLARSNFAVPKNAREMIIRIGLNGATGTLDFDDMKLIPIRR